MAAYNCALIADFFGDARAVRLRWWTKKALRSI